MTPRRIRGLVVVAFVALGLVVLAAVNLYLTLDSEEVGAWIAPRASAALNRPVTIGEAGVSLWPRPSVRVRDVRVENLPDFRGPALAQVEAARLDVAWLPLIVGRVHVRRVQLESASLHMAIDEHGASNFGNLVPRADGSGGTLPAAVALRISEIALSNGSLTYFDAHRGRSLVVSGVQAVAALAESGEGGWQSTVAATSDSLLVRIAGVGEEIVRGAGPTAILRAHSGTERGTIDIDEGRIAFAEDTLSVYGALSFGSSEPALDLLVTDENVSARFLTDLFPSQKRSELLPLVEGSLDVMVQLHGGGGTPPSLRGSVRLRDVGVRIRGEPLVDQVGGLVALTPDTITLDSLAGRFAGGPFELSGTVARRAGVAAFVARGQPDLDAFDRLGLLPEGVTLSGDADLFMSIAGPTGSLDSIEVVGTALLKGLQLEHPALGVPVYVPAGDLSVLGREAHWSELTVLLGQDRVTTSGSILDLFDLWPRAERPPHVEVSLAAPRLDLNAALPPRDTTSDATYAQLAFAHLGSRVLKGRTAATIATARQLARPDSLPARGAVELRVDTLLFRRHALAGVTARLVLADTALEVPHAAFAAWGGSASGSLSLGVGPDLAEPFALALSLEGIDAVSFLEAMSPVGEAVSGTLDLELEVEGATDATLLPLGEGLAGRVAMTLADGEVAGTGVNMALADFLGSDTWLDVPFDAWVLEIGVRDGVLDIRDASLMGDEGDVVFSGPLRLDGSADLSMGVSIPSRHLGEVSLRRTGIGQSVLERLRAAGGSLELGLRLSGWLQAPTLEPDASNAVASAR